MWKRDKNNFPEFPSFSIQQRACSSCEYWKIPSSDHYNDLHVRNRRIWWNYRNSDITYITFYFTENPMMNVRRTFSMTLLTCGRHFANRTFNLTWLKPLMKNCKKYTMQEYIILQAVNAEWKGCQLWKLK